MPFAFRLHLLLSVWWTLACALNELDIDRDHLVYVRKGLPWHGYRLTKKQNEELQKSCGAYIGIVLDMGMCSNSEQVDGEVSAVPMRRIAFGQQASPYRHPWSVALTNYGNTFCSGTLISDRHVLTAAHCFFEYSVNKLPCENGTFMTDRTRTATILYGGICTHAGSICQQKRMQAAKMKRVIFPLSFNDEGCHTSDYAIVELSRPVKSDEYIWPICLRRINESDLFNEEKPTTPLYNNKRNNKRKSKFGNATHLGWGRTEHGRTALLHFFNPTIVDVTGSHIITSADNSGRTCIGDSGGTLEAIHFRERRVVQLGITSIGLPCEGDQKGYALNVFVPSILDVVCHFTGVCAPNLNDA